MLHPCMIEKNGFGYDAKKERYTNLSSDMNELSEMPDANNEESR